MKIDGLWARIISCAVFLSAFVVVPLRMYDGLDLVPGDFGDARLNNYFLESIYQFFGGRVPSLWHLSFFFPFPWISGLSDNLFGSSPVYIGARVAGMAPDTAFQIWFLAGYGANFAAAHYALRRLGGSPLAATIGALIFAFALPTSAHASHAQLHFRFGIPLALLFFAEFLDRKNWQVLLSAFAWLVWQFYTGIYMGFFALALMALMVPVHVVCAGWFSSKGRLGNQFSDLGSDWTARTRKRRIRLGLGFALLCALMVLLFFPYVQAKEVYGISRSWTEISRMLPRMQSYLLSDGSGIWSSTGNSLFDALPRRHEHQMFIGLMPFLLALAGFLIALRTGFSHVVLLLVASMGLLILFTISIGGYSLWYLFHWLPLASAIRAMTRFDQVLLFPVGVLAMIAIDALRQRFAPRLALVASGVVIVACIIEMAAFEAQSSKKALWRERIVTAEALLPAALPPDAILFMAQRDGPYYADELDAMWVALRRGIPTMNGYSGSAPPWVDRRFGADCRELSRRILSYEILFPAPEPDRVFRDLMDRIVLVGFGSCDPEGVRKRPAISVSDVPYSAEDILHLSYQIVGADPKVGEFVVRIENTASFAFSAWSGIGKHLRLVWRFLDSEGTPLSGWDYRKALPADIPAEGQLDVTLPFQIPQGAASMEFRVQ